MRDRVSVHDFVRTMVLEVDRAMEDGTLAVSFVRKNWAQVFLRVGATIEPGNQKTLTIPTEKIAEDTMVELYTLLNRAYVVALQFSHVS